MEQTGFITMLIFCFSFTILR